MINSRVRKHYCSGAVNIILDFDNLNDGRYAFSNNAYLLCGFLSFKTESDIAVLRFSAVQFCF